MYTAQVVQLIRLYLVLGSTVDQTVNTVLVQLGATRHLYYTSDMPPVYHYDLNVVVGVLMKDGTR